MRDSRRPVIRTVSWDEPGHTATVAAIDRIQRRRPLVVVYDVENRRLVINEREAELVRRIFRDMLATRSITRISEQLFLEGITTKAWTTQKGKLRPGVPMDKKHLNKVLRNRIYLGELSHKGSWVSGTHPALLDRELFDAVQAVMDARVRTQPKKSREAMEASTCRWCGDSCDSPCSHRMWSSACSLMATPNSIR